MSKLSAQCDELRSMSESVGLAMPQAATLMMEAADAIEGLESNNAKLRELCEYLWEFAKTCGADHPFLRELGIEAEQ